LKDPLEIMPDDIIDMHGDDAKVIAKRGTYFSEWGYEVMLLARSNRFNVDYLYRDGMWEILTGNHRGDIDDAIVHANKIRTLAEFAWNGSDAKGEK